MNRCRCTWGTLPALILLVGLLITGTALARTTVTISGPFGSWGDSLQTALDTFSAENDVDVEIVDMVSWTQAKEKVAAMTAAGIAPDVMYGDDATLNYYITNGLSQPITPFAARDIDLGRYPAEVLNVLRYDGKDYVLPTALSVYNTYYSLDMFDKSGVAYPAWDWSSDEFTWDDFVEAARKMTLDKDGDGHPDQFGTQNFGWPAGLNQVGIWGLYIVNSSATEFYGDSPEVIAALEKTTSLWTEYNVVGGSLTNGDAAMATYQAGSLNRMKQLTERGEMARWGVGIMPSGSRRAAESSFHGLSISSHSSHPELAWKLAKYLAYDAAGAVMFTRAENRVPVLPETGRDFAERWASILSPHSVRALIDSPPYAWGNEMQIMRHPKGAQEIYPLLRDASQKMIKGEASVRDAMAQVAPTIRALLQER